MNDYNKEDYLQDRQSAMTRLMHVSPENSLNKAYDEGYKRGVLDTHMCFTISAQNALIALRRLPDHADSPPEASECGVSMKMVSIDPPTLERLRKAVGLTEEEK